jgi:hypothetical protein
LWWGAGILGQQMAPQALRSAGIDAHHRGDPEFDDWLRASHGFRVLGPHGRIGTVKSHRYRWNGSLEALILSRGLFGSQAFELPAEEIEWVLPKGRRLLVPASPGAGDATSAGGPLQSLKEPTEAWR